MVINKNLWLSLFLFSACLSFARTVSEDDFRYEPARERYPPDLSASLSYAPAVPIYGYLRDLFDGGIYPPGFSVQADFLPHKGDWGSLGVETFLSWNYLAVAKTNLRARGHLFDFRLNLLYQYTLSPRLVLGLSLGGGPVLVHELSYHISGAGQDSISTWIPSMGGGVSLKWLFHPHVFAGLGLDYVNLFSVDGPQGFLFPRISVGWKY
jgi:hypothetical protein